MRPTTWWLPLAGQPAAVGPRREPDPAPGPLHGGGQAGESELAVDLAAGLGRVGTVHGEIPGSVVWIEVRHRIVSQEELAACILAVLEGRGPGREG